MPISRQAAPLSEYTRFGIGGPADLLLDVCCEDQRIRTFTNAECEFAYRESIFKRHKGWIILSAELALDPADPGELKKIADNILAMRNAKYPPTMKCAGSIFKNLLWQELPDAVRAV